MRIEVEYQNFTSGYDSREKGPLRGEISYIVRCLQGRRISQLGLAVLQIGSKQDCRRLIDMLYQIENCFDRNVLPAEVIIPVEGETESKEFLLKMKQKEHKENKEKTKLLGK